MHKKIVLIGILLIGFTAGALAQNAASANVSATIVSTKTAEMSFGSLTTNGNAGTIVLTPGGKPTATGGVTLPSAAGLVTAAAFKVTGEESYTYSITLPSADYTITKTGSSETMTANTFTSNLASAGTLSAGTQSITVGVTLKVDANQTPGTYENAAGFDVTVNYN